MFGISRFWTIVIIITVFVGGYAFFGTSSLDEMRKNRAIRKTKSLVEKIVNNAKNKEKTKISLTGENHSTGLKYGLDTSADVQSGSTTQSTKGSPITKTTSPRTNTDTATNPSATPGAAVKSAPVDRYYPPASDPNTLHRKAKPQSSKQPDAPLTKEEVLGNNEGIRLEKKITQNNTDQNRPAKAQPKNNNYSIENVYVSFQGTKAFTKDGEGNKMPLADGYYDLPGTNRQIFIQNGEKTMAY